MKKDEKIIQVIPFVDNNTKYERGANFPEFLLLSDKGKIYVGVLSPTEGEGEKYYNEITYSESNLKNL